MRLNGTVRGLVIIAAVGVIGRLRNGLRSYDALAPTP